MRQAFTISLHKRAQEQRMNITSYGNLSTTLGDDGAGLTLSSALKSGQSLKSSLNVSTAQDETAADQGDSVSISEEAKALAAQVGETAAASNASTAISGSFTIDGGSLSMTGSSSTGEAEDLDESSAAADSSYQKILKEISKLQQQIKEVESDPTLTDEQRRQQVQQLQTQLLTLMSQLEKAKGESAGDPLSYKGGTRAEGMASSLT